MLDWLSDIDDGSTSQSFHGIQISSQIDSEINDMTSQWDE